MDIRVIHRTTKEHIGPNVGCPDCGGQTQPVIGTDEQWWLSMEAHYGLPQPMLKDLIGQWEGQSAIIRFGDWLELYVEGKV